MASSFEKSVKGATKIKLAPPKSKYIEHILIATHSGDHGIAEIFRALQNRLRDSTWTVVFKALIVVHLMIREGEPNVTLRYLAENPKNKLAISNFTEVQTQGRNIRIYSDYLRRRAVAFQRTKVDYVRNGDGRLKRLTIDKGLLMETEVVQRQIEALLRCDFLMDEAENEITLFSFRLLTMDLLALYQVMNEGIINILEHYFEFSKPDAERSVEIYRLFCKQTDQTVQYLATARQFEHVTRLEIPKIKHAPTSLATSLEEYLNDRDFEINRRQYMAQHDAKRRSGRGGTSNGLQTITEKASSSAAARSAADQKVASPTITTTSPTSPVAKGPAPDLIDFFESIEQNQQTLPQSAPQFDFGTQQIPQHGFPGQQTGYLQQNAGFSQPQATGFAPQQNAFVTGAGQGLNPFGQPSQQQQPQLQTNFTDAGFGGYNTAAQQPFNAPMSPGGGPADFAAQQQQSNPTGSTNPFRQSMMPQPTSGSPTSFGGAAPTSLALNPNRMSTNPFARGPAAGPAQSFSTPASPPITQQSPPFSPQSQFGQQQQAQQNGSPFAPLQAQQTGTNPFARSQNQSGIPTGQQGHLAPVAANVTGSTNPFRQSAFINSSTGQGWQSSPQSQGIFGGTNLGNVDTTPVFPRPGVG